MRRNSKSVSKMKFFGRLKFLQKFLPWGGMLILAGILAFRGCGRKKQASLPPVPVVLAAATVENVPLYIETIGLCVASESVDMVPQVSGQIVGVNFKQGQDVRAGDSLYTIDSRTYEANLGKAEAQLETALAKMRIDVAQMERSKALVPQNYISQQQYESYEAQAAQSVASVEAARAQMAQARVDLEHCNIVSPIDGTTGAYLVDVGNVVNAAANRSLVTVANVDRLYVEFSVSENDFYNLQKFFGSSGGRLKVEVSPVSGEGVSGEAFVEFITNSINVKTGSIKLRALMENGGRKFWPGQSIRAKLLLTILENSVTVPAEAVKLGQQGRYVFVVGDDKTAQLRLVEIGQMHGGRLVVNGGVKPGEVVVKRGQLMLAPGMKVVEMPDTPSVTFQQSLEKNKKIAEKNPTTE
jgi:multidrug efflux system membrane fusion protein